MIFRVVCVRFWDRSIGLVARKFAGHHPIWYFNPFLCQFYSPYYWVWNHPTINLQEMLQKNLKDQSHGVRTDLVLGKTKYPELRTIFLVQVCFQISNRGDASLISYNRSFGISVNDVLLRVSYQYRHRFYLILQH